MAYLTGSISFKAYIDTAQTEFPQELVADISKEFSSSAITGVETTTFSLAASGSQTINFNSITGVKRFYLYSNTTDINVNMNGLGNITSAAQTVGLAPFSVTSMVITNASSSTATTVTVILIAS